jgi:hypothetical protein
VNKYRKEYELYKTKYKDDSTKKYMGEKAHTPSRKYQDSDYHKYKNAAD